MALNLTNTSEQLLRLDSLSGFHHLFSIDVFAISVLSAHWKV